MAQSIHYCIFPTICTIKKVLHVTITQNQRSFGENVGTPVFHVIMSASVFNSYAFLERKALLRSQQPMVQNKAAEEQVGPHL